MNQRPSIISRFSEFFLNNYRVSILLLVAIMVAGWWGATSNQRQDFPEIKVNMVIVTAVYPGASAEDVEQDVLAPIEAAASSLDHVTGVRSTARQNFGNLTVSVDSSDQANDVASKLSDELPRVGLPQDAEAKVQTIDATGVSMALGLVSTNGETIDELLTYAGTVKAQLESSSDEVKRVEIIPEAKFSITVALDPIQLAARRLDYQTVRSAINSAITSIPGGSVKTDSGREEPITIDAPVQSVTALENLSINGVRLADVATISRVPLNDSGIQFVGYTKDDRGFAKEAVYLLVYKNSDGDIITLSDGVEAAINTLESDGSLPDGVQVVTAYDNSPYIEDQLSTLLQNGYIGLLLIVIVLLLFVNLRTAIIVGLIIPLSLLVTLFALTTFGFTLNILTLFAMIFALGILVDNAIVVNQGMVHEIEKGATRRQAAGLVIRKLGPAVAASTVTTVIAFIPFASIEGIMGDFLKFIPYTVIIMLVSSFFLAITISPLFGSWLLREQSFEQRRQQGIRRWERWLVLPLMARAGQRATDWLAVAYSRTMGWIFQRWYAKVGILVVSLVLFGVSVGVFAPRLDFEQFPSTDTTTMQVNFDFPVGTTTEQKKTVVADTADKVVQLPHFQTFYMFDDIMYTTFTDPKERADGQTIFEIEERLEADLASVRTAWPDVTIEPAATTYGPPTDKYNIVVEFLDNDREALRRAATDLTSFIENQPNVQEVVNGLEDLLVPSVRVSLDQDKLAAAGVDPLVASGLVNSVFSSQKIGSVAFGDEGVSDELQLTFNDTAAGSIANLRSLMVPSARGLVRLDTVADIQETETQVALNRLDGRRVARVSAILTDDGDATVLDQAVRDYLTEDKLRSYGLAADGVSYGGQFAEFNSDFSNLQIVFLLAMLGVYLVLVYQFNSFLQPLLIMGTIPIAMIGVFPSLLLVDSSLNMVSGLGVIAIVGIVVNNAIVLMSTYNRYREETPEESAQQSLVRAGAARLSPIIATTITTMGGILPITIADPFWTGLGAALIGGLFIAMFGTLLILPIIYAFGHRMVEKWQRRKQKQVGASETFRPTG